MIKQTMDCSCNGIFDKVIPAFFDADLRIFFNEGRCSSNE